MAEPLRLTRLVFKAGPKPGAAPLSVDVSRIVLLVGPNNSGKSVALNETEGLCKAGQSSGLVIASAGLNFPALTKDAVQLLAPFRLPTPPELDPDALLLTDQVLPGGRGIHQTSSRAIEGAIREGTPQILATTFGRWLTIRLDGKTRLSLCDEQPAGDLNQPPQNHLARIFQSEALEARVRDLTYDAFQEHLVIDPTAMGPLRIKLTRIQPGEEVAQRRLDPPALAYYQQASSIQAYGDGVKAFVGLTMAVVSAPQTILLIDEPDAFLHPPLSRRLGRDLVNLASERKGTLVAATHSADFVFGALEAAGEATIVRVTYENRVGTARSLDAARLRTLMRQPLLRSVGALRGLFHKSVVCCEGDTDRAFYDEINHRLVGSGRGVNDALFLNAQNWQTIGQIIGPLRALGVPAAAVIDFDTLAVDPGQWPNLVNAMYLEPAEANRLEMDRARSAAHLRASGGDYKKHGLSVLSEPQRSEVKRFIDEVAKYGVFVVETGEVESWLPTLKVSGHGPEWLVKAFTALGENPEAPGYVVPSSGDVWAFLDRIATWTINPLRQGIP